MTYSQTVQKYFKEGDCLDKQAVSSFKKNWGQGEQLETSSIF